MRKWHRWLSVAFGVVLLWIALTGMLSQVVPMVLDATQGKAAPVASGPAFTCPPDYTCRPKPKPGDPRGMISTLHHLHSGESFGQIGVVLFTLASFAMVFFAVSGMWLYLRMWQNRRRRAQKPAWFWH